MRVSPVTGRKVTRRLEGTAVGGRACPCFLLGGSTFRPKEAVGITRGVGSLTPPRPTGPVRASGPAGRKRGRLA